MAEKALEKKKQKREALLNAAFDLFSINGVTDTSIAGIAERASVAKGTFYLYFKDKYDIHRHLIAHKASAIFRRAKAEIEAQNVAKEGGVNPSDFSLEDKIILLSDNIISQLQEDPSLLRFISKNLSWGIFKNELIESRDPEDVDFASIFHEAIDASPVKYRDPEVMIYMIIELLGSTCYSAILYGEPLTAAQLKPYLFDAIRAVMRSMEEKGES